MLNFFLYFLSGVALVMVCLLFGITQIGLNQSWYSNEFSLLKISPDPAQVENLFSYIKGTSELDKNFYTEKEILHLVDIQNLIGKIEKIYKISITSLGIVLSLLFLTFGPRKFFSGLFFSSATAMALCGLIIVSFFVGFDYFFNYFHKIYFTNDYWQLDPAVDNLINIFPPQLFFNLSSQIAVYALAIAGSIFFVSGLITAGFALRKSDKI